MDPNNNRVSDQLMVSSYPAQEANLPELSQARVIPDGEGLRKASN